LPDLLLGEAHGGRVIIEGSAVEEVDHEHVVAVRAQPFGGVEDALADTQDGMKERDRRHGSHGDCRGSRGARGGELSRQPGWLPE
jgi:hypothetical protein